VAVKRYEVSQAEFQNTLDNLNEGFFSCDASWRLILINARAEAMLGVKRSDVLGGRLWEIFPDISGTRLETGLRLAASGEAHDNCDYRARDGCFLQCRCFPRKTGGVAVYIRDITERRIMEESSRKKQEMLDFALRISNMSNWELNLDDNTITRAPEYDMIFGYESGLPGFTYGTLLEHVISEDRQKVELSFEKAFADQTDLDLECRIRRKNGEIRWIWIYGNLQEDEAGKSYMNGFIRDNTNSRMIIEDLEAKTRLIKELDMTLKVVLQYQNEEKRKMEERFAANTKRIIMPYLDKIRKERLSPEQSSYVSIIEANLAQLISPLIHALQQFNFTPREIQIASLIKDGKTTKDIASIIGVAPSAINVYRNKIRSKLKLNGKKINLQQHLQSVR